MLGSIIEGTITVSTLLICLGCAVALGIFTALVFLFKSRHSASFALTLALLPVTIAVVIMLVNGNVGTGIAVAGAFTLVRFRSVPGTAREIAAIFTAMAQGLAIGMGYVGIAAIFFVVTAVFTLLLTAFNFGAAPDTQKQLKITLPENVSYNGLFDDIFKKYTKKAVLTRVRMTNMGTLFELSYDVDFNDSVPPKEFIDELRVRNGNLNIAVGDFASIESL